MTLTWHPPTSLVEGYGVLSSDDGRRWILHRQLRIEDGGLTTGEAEPVNCCEHCGRCAWVVPPPQTLDGAIERGWLVEILD